ncbi:MAG: hypothetical protein WA156_04760 [Methylocystis silviterrae]|jgi:hypothetical protein
MAATAYRLKVAVAWIFVFIAVGCGAVAAAPMLRHYLVAVLNDPVNLPALKSDARVHYEPGADGSKPACLNINGLGALIAARSWGENRLLLTNVTMARQHLSDNALRCIFSLAAR